VSTLDLANLPRTAEGKVDFAQDFFGREAFLTVSGQLNIEAYCLALTKVYTFGPTLRAENSNTSRHLAEFWMIEPEIAFADLSDNAALGEALLKYTFASLLKEREEDLAFFDQRIEKGLVAKLEGIVGSEFAHLDYGEAIGVLERSNEKFEFPVNWGADLQSEHERYLTEKYAKKPVVVMNYPKAIKAFYMRVNDDDRTVAAMDVLAPGIGEAATGEEGSRWAGSVGGDQRQPGKVAAITRSIAGQQPISGNRRVGSNKKVRKRRPLCAPALPVSQKALPREECGLIRDCFALQHCVRQRRLQILDSRKAN
jgi:asparaginyl-tRNA synthetase